MQAIEQLSTLPAAEGSGQPSLGGSTSDSSKQESKHADVTGVCGNPSGEQMPPPPSPRSCRVDRPAQNPAVSGAHLRPLPTIETLMTYPAISRPLYDRLVRGEPPADNYKTVIHTPKPYNMRALDQSILRTGDVPANRRRKRANSGPRSRSSTASSTSSSHSQSSSSSSLAESETSVYDSSGPSSPASVSSTSKATIASSPAGSPQRYVFPSLVSEPAKPVLTPLIPRSPSIESEILNAYSDPSSRVSSPSPAQSFHSSLSAWSTTSSEGSAPHSTRSSAPSPASSAYPSPPSSPVPSRRSSSSGEEFLYPSPPPSPRPMQFGRGPQSVPMGRERRAFSTPPPPAPTPPLPLRRRSATLASRPLSHSGSTGMSTHELDAWEFDLGEQTLGGGMLFDVDEEGEGDAMEWSMNGGKIEDGEVVYGAAGVAVSPRAMRGRCCECGHEGEGLGLYVIDEEDGEMEEEDVNMGGGQVVG